MVRAMSWTGYDTEEMEYAHSGDDSGDTDAEQGRRVRNGDGLLLSDME